MKNLAIKAENISKQYRLGEVGTGTLTHDLNRFWSKVRGKEDPYLKIGESNDRSSKGTSDYVWSLRDINFEVEAGEAVGIIGRNGAGKSTLLKLLSKVTKPTTGNFKVNGRIASLLEVGTGFNPEMTGRENIYLNGAILGMRRAEITKKFDEIVAFSGVDRYIDTPVKRYSSGMYVRLAFAVAAHLESEILIVDEVLAVGDAEFQKKCLGKMGDVSKSEGRTVLFVSHNMAAVKALCTKGIVLENGLLKFEGFAQQALDIYNSESSNTDSKIFWDFENAPGNANAKITAVELKTKDNFFTIEKDFELEVTFVNVVVNQTLNVSISIHDDKEVYVLSSPNLKREQFEKGTFKSVCKIPKNLLNKGVYFFSVLLVGNNYEIITQLDKIVAVDVDEEGLYRENYYGYWAGAVRPYLEWTNSKM
ncbi:ABC transporter ATP-binding protein [Flavobacterium sp. SUN052]|uniref:ABC transporter ATP-binding protein n=1 Tax=Flavobacterium sp. SUN052 TaxID=3002441 RepID=UPI00237D3E20|nr:ABC transporter ATP-binding protein [Flavobacterium sp. SUN052]MEC4004436.1 ABC transporter ATP-binding protein [Flavobacterium sp. SUN052]